MDGVINITHRVLSLTSNGLTVLTVQIVTFSRQSGCLKFNYVCSNHLRYKLMSADLFI